LEVEKNRLPDTSDLIHWQGELENFLHGDGIVLAIPYKGDDLNPRRFWHALARRNPLQFAWQAFIVALTTYLPAGPKKNGLLRSIGMRIGREAFIASGVFFDVEFPTLIEIGEGAIIGTKTQILTHDVTIRTVRIGRVKIGRQAVVGVGCVLRSGIRIGEGAVVSMNSFVNRDVADRELCGGNPLKTIRMLDDLI
jgi:serine acetyltransferase